MIDELTNENYEMFCMAIIVKAIKDYKSSTKKVHKIRKKKKTMIELLGDEYEMLYLDPVVYKEKHRAEKKLFDNDDEFEKKVAKENKMRTRWGRLENEEVEHLRMISECRSFFLSPWCDFLCGINNDKKGSDIIKRLDAELVSKGFEIINE